MTHKAPGEWSRLCWRLHTRGAGAGELLGTWARGHRQSMKGARGVETTRADGSIRSREVAKMSGRREFHACPVDHSSQVLRLNSSAVGALSTGHVVNLVSNDVRRWAARAHGHVHTAECLAATHFLSPLGPAQPGVGCRTRLCALLPWPLSRCACTAPGALAMPP